ncbi:hypothetical protein N7513_000540 [Penicillium frequentans]|nr:hypothetical protein N7513_000540 [Penicillium glabrum]
MWFGTSSTEQQVVNEVLSVLSSSSTSLSEIAERSRESILSWLPIISIPELVWKTDQLQQEPSADVAVLLLAVHLMNELSTPPALQHDRDSAPVLELCRRLFLNLFQERTASLETVQAGVILSALQLDAGQLNDASSTITLCANMGIRLSLNNMPVVETGLYSRLGVMKRNIWYAIILLERLINVADPCSSAAVVITDESLDREFAQNLSRNTSLPSECEETYDDFVFQTRAAYMLGKVCSYVRTHSIGCSSCLEAKFWDLDYTLRMMGIAAVEKSSRGGGSLPCIASPLIFTAMAMLYQFKLEYDAQCKQDQILTCTPAYMALVSVTSMVHDIARARLPINGPVIFPGIISLYHVAKATSSLHRLRLDSGIVVNNIVDTLRALTHRSKLAGIYVERL